MDQTIEERTRGQHHRPGQVFGPITGDNTLNTVLVINDQVLDTAFKNGEVFLFSEDVLHGLAIQLAIGLRTRPAHGGALGTIEHPELDARTVNRATHHTVKRINFAHHMPLAQTTDGRVA